MLNRTLFALGAFCLQVGCAPTPTIQIVEPGDGDTFLLTDAITITVAATDFTFSSDHLGQENADAEGHWHLYVDEGESPVSVSADNSVQIIPAELGLTAGLHTLRAELANNDHSTLEEPIADSVEIVLQ